MGATHRLFHQESFFDYEKFFLSVYAILDPLVQGNLTFSATFIKEGEDGKPFAQYRIRDLDRKIADFADEARFLEEYKITLEYSKDNPHKTFSVFKMYNTFARLDPDKRGAESGLSPTNLVDYFPRGEKEFIPPEKYDFGQMEHTVENFQKAENVYVGVLARGKNINASEYIPFPIICRGYLVGALYLIIDSGNLRSKKIDSTLQTYNRLITLQITREYERNINEAKVNVYSPKPEDPLEDYREIIQDLTREYLPYEGGELQAKKIPYEFVYDEAVIADENFKRIITDTPFLLNMGYDDYYEHLITVLAKESRLIQAAKFERIKMAITSIIVDSFAHNVGAHSLVALKWWFQNRYKIVSHKFKVEGNEELSSKFDIQRIRDKMTSLQQEFTQIVPFHSFLDRSDLKEDEHHLSLIDALRFFVGEELFNPLNLKNKEEKSITHYPPPAASALVYFFQYLRDKSSFWSGVARDVVFSGRVRTWPSILRSFINNSLFLGTIAHSEGINKVNIYLELRCKESGKVNIVGEFARIDLSIIEREQNEAMQQETDSQSFFKDEMGYSPYAFLRPGAQFKEIKKQLEELDPVFLPNGVIGLHALYTLIENTLRNIKHYKSSIADIQKEGINLFLSIQEVPFRSREAAKHKQSSTSEFPLYMVGAWLHHEQDLMVNNESVILKHTEQLKKRVVDKYGNAILGGSSQDKVCAAMLMNNRFQSIDDMNLNRVKRHYFPYVFAASESYTAPEKRIEIKINDDDHIERIDKNITISHEERKQDYLKSIKEKGERGIIKKFFHIWKGSKLKLISQSFDRQSENISRFNIVAIQEFKDEEGVPVPFRLKEKPIPSFKKKDEEEKDNKEEYPRKNSAEYHLRNEGVIRLVEYDPTWGEDTKSNIVFTSAMVSWLKDWLIGDGDSTVLRLGIIKYLQKRGAVNAGMLILEKERDSENWMLSYKNRYDLDEMRGLQADSVFPVAHGSLKKERPEEENKPSKSGKLICQVRSHGAFISSIYADGLEKEELSIEYLGEAEFTSLEKPAKLLETILTKTFFFDNRVTERIQARSEEDVKKLAKYLNIEAYEEFEHLFDTHKDHILGLTEENPQDKYMGRFITIHLSFLETIKKPGAGAGYYSENEVELFFKQQIEEYYYEQTEGNALPYNFILVITSGRGRGDWFKATNHPQITFRPIEAIVDGIEHGLGLEDDFQVKYNLCNVYFGS
ncbi:MAG: hypothetical protein AAF388_02055 [Bacteroidota bacterium]